MKHLLIAFLVIGCQNQHARSAADFCALRAAYKTIADGRLDPEPGSPRAKLEAAEDRFCATLSP